MLGCKGLTFSVGKTIFNQTDHQVLVRKSNSVVVIGTARFTLFFSHCSNNGGNYISPLPIKVISRTYRDSEKI